MSKKLQWHHDATCGFETHSHAFDELLTEKKTQFQEMRVLNAPKYGKFLVLDGKIQSSQRDEFIYHEALVCPAMVALPQAKRILVIGGGEGATLRDIYRFAQVERVVMVDIDGEVVEACKEHLPEFHQGAFSDSRTHLVIDDARAYVENCDEKFDLIVSDISEALEGTTAAYMFTREFFQQAATLLTDSGGLVVQSGFINIGDLNFFLRVNRTLRTVFPSIHPYRAFVPCFGTDWGFHFVSKKTAFEFPTKDAIDRQLEESGASARLRYYDGEAHQGMVHLPKFVRSELAKEWQIFTAADRPKVY